jgi:nucleolar GTP-binding protein
MVSTAEPEIAYYPFTTKKVIVGHLKIDNQSVQIVDTPGLLDRPMSKRNEIELQAIAALKYLAHVIIFMIDPSEACGWPLNEQFQLYEEIRRMFPLVPMPVTFNKVDITPPENLTAARAKVPDAHEIVAIEGTGVAELMRLAVGEVDLTSIKEQVEEYVASLSEREIKPFDS